MLEIEPQSAILSFLFTSEAGPGASVGLMQNNVCCAVSPLLREPLGASRDPAGSESLPALLHHCITKAKGVAANNNNNTSSGRRTGSSGASERRFIPKCASGVSLPALLSGSRFRCVSLSDPAAISDTPRGRGPPQKEEKAQQEEPLYLFNLLPAPQAVWGGPDRHTGQCRLRGPKLWDSSLTRGHTKPLDSTRLDPTSALCAPPWSPADAFLIISTSSSGGLGSGKNVLLNTRVMEILFQGEDSGSSEWSTTATRISLENALKICNVYK